MTDQPRKIHLGYLGNHQRKIRDAIKHNRLYELKLIANQRSNK